MALINACWIGLAKDGPISYVLQVFKTGGQVLRPILRGSHLRLDKGVAAFRNDLKPVIQAQRRLIAR